MSKLSWAVVCCLVIFNSAALVADFNCGVKGAGCREDSCADYSIVFYECWHAVGASNGADCQQGECIVNTMTFVSCGSGEESSCTNTFDPSVEWATQDVYTMPMGNLCQSDWHVNWTEHPEHPNPCIKRRSFATACETGGCNGGTHDRRDPVRKGRYICGC